MYDAMTYAARLTVRPTVAKLMLLLNCELIYERVIYAEASVMLKEHDIRLHYLAPTNFTLSNGRPAMTDLFGFDRRAVYTARNLNTRTGDARLRMHLKTPKDYLSALAMDSGGLVFSQTFLSAGAPNLKTASSVLGRQVARLGAPTECQVRHCISSRLGTKTLSKI